jgi:hypothetical protein
MFTFIKKLFGFDQETMKAAGVQTEQAPYKVPEPAATTPIPAHDIAPQPIIAEGAGIVETVAAPQITNVVTEKPAATKPARKPRAPKTVAPAEKPAVKKAAPVKKAAAMKAAPKKPRSKKV